MASLTVVKPGMLTTVQDLGRWGHQHVGVPVAGPMDWYSHRLANRIAGNGDAAACLEITLIGPELVADGDIQCVVTGAEFDLKVGDRPVPTLAPFLLRSGERLRFGMRRAGARSTLAVCGGFAVPEILGSRATSLISGLGPFGGRALRAGDVLSIAARDEGHRTSLSYDARPLPLPTGGGALRVMLGPHDQDFAPTSLQRLRAARYVITPESNRMGYRLAGPPLEYAHSGDMLSDATPVGSVQVPPSGQPILLMADRQTTGGYPKIATVITADLPLAGQLAPGDWIKFVPCEPQAARDALLEREAGLQGTAR